MDTASFPNMSPQNLDVKELHTLYILHVVLHLEI